jgi:hypothetical protein
LRLHANLFSRRAHESKDYAEDKESRQDAECHCAQRSAKEHGEVKKIGHRFYPKSLDATWAANGRMLLPGVEAE